MNPDNTPAKDIPVVVNPGKVKGHTADNGMAKLSINTVENSENIIITVCLIVNLMFCNVVYCQVIANYALISLFISLYVRKNTALKMLYNFSYVVGNSQ